MTCAALLTVLYRSADQNGMAFVQILRSPAGCNSRSDIRHQEAVHISTLTTTTPELLYSLQRDLILWIPLFSITLVFSLDIQIVLRDSWMRLSILPILVEGAGIGTFRMSM
jgi:hypothetical protein